MNFLYDTYAISHVGIDGWNWSQVLYADWMLGEDCVTHVMQYEYE